MSRHAASHRGSLRLFIMLATVAMAVLAGVGLSASPASADTYVPISGAGSTWSQNAIDQWRRNVNQYGLRVNYAGTGSSDGRNQFRNGTVDFGVSEIPYGLTDNNVVDNPPTRPYAYLPIVAGGTSFMYNLKVGGKQVTNLRLSGQTLSKIFTGAITSWADPAINADNPGLVLPARKIVPVVRSDGSGTTAQFTAYMSKQYPDVWNAYCAKAGRATPCGLTSFYPVIPGSGFTAQSGSLGVSGYVSQSANEGTINYVEYSYALNAGFPVVKLLNQSGYYVEPTAQSVAVALLSAQIDETPTSPTYLQPNLVPVYNSTDKRAYPMSSYSYMIVPTATTDTFSADKGKTLGAFAYYFLCEGQQQAPVLGYSPLPINLVQSGLNQVRKIPGVVAENVDITKCNNPTFSSDGTNTLAITAPSPAPCDQQGPYQCSTGTAGAANTPTAVLASAIPPTGAAAAPTSGTGTTTSSTKPSPGSTKPSPGSTKPSAGSTQKPTPGQTAAGAGPGSTKPGTATTLPSAGPAGATGSAGPPAVDPDTGATAGTEGQAQTTSSDQAVVAQPVSFASSSGWQTQYTLMLLAVALLVGVTVGPPLVARALGNRGDDS